MKSEYAAWIAENVKNDGYGQCAEITLAMVFVFPELIRVRGHYHCPSWGEREHWWLCDPNGNIVDPTAGQFPSKGEGHYEEWNEGTPEPTGLCPNCGRYVYDGGTCCSDSCSQAYAAFCTNSW